jgi:hypothetical protein
MLNYVNFSFAIPLLWLYGPLLGLGSFFSFLIYTQSVELLGRGISPPQGRYLHTEEHKHRINAHRHPCLEWDSNPRSQRSSWRRRFMARPRGLCFRRFPYLITSKLYRRSWVAFPQLRPRVDPVYYETGMTAVYCVFCPLHSF